MAYTDHPLIDVQTSFDETITFQIAQESKTLLKTDLNLILQWSLGEIRGYYVLKGLQPEKLCISASKQDR